MAIDTEIPSYIINPDETPESVRRRRALAELMIRRGGDFSPVQHWTQGAARVANALVGGMLANQADKEERAREAEGAARLANLPGLSGMGTGAPSMPSVRPMGMSGGGTPTAMPAVSSEIPPEGRALLTAISGSESNYPGKDPYKVIYGGREATSFADHPRQYVPIVSGPNRGQKTSAAGRYQYLGRSWDEAKNALNLPDFSPESQDKAAWWDAQRTYRKNTGRDLADDIKLAGNDPQKLSAIGRGISTWWTSLPGGIEPNKATGSFGSRFARALQLPSQPLGPQVADTSGYAPTAPMSPQSMAYAPETVGASGMGATVPQAAMTAGPGQATPQASQPQPTQVAQAGGIDPDMARYIQGLVTSRDPKIRQYGLQLYQSERARVSRQEAPPTDVREYEYGLRNPDFARRQIELKQAGRAQTQVNVGGGSDKQVFDAMEKSAATAQTAANGLVSIGEARKAVEGGAILGAGADFRLGLQKVGAALGVGDPQAIVNTETFRSAIAPQVAALMKATVGSTQISNADREFAEKAAGGSITLDEGTIKRLLGIMERAGKAVVSQHRRRLDKVYPANGQFERERALFDVEDAQPLPSPETLAPRKPTPEEAAAELRRRQQGSM